MKSPPLKKVAKQTTLSGSGRASTMMAKKVGANIQLCCLLVSRIVYTGRSFLSVVRSIAFRRNRSETKIYRLKAELRTDTCCLVTAHLESIMIFRGPYADVTIPEVSLTDFILKSKPELKDKRALIDGPTGRSLTYSHLEDSVRRTAASLAKRGFKKGDVFGIFSTNCPEYAVAFHAVAMLGGINTTLNPLYTAEEAAHQLRDAGAKFLVAPPLFIEKARTAAQQSKVEELFVFGEANHTTPFASLLDSDGDVPHVEINPREDLVALPYSSGTTGLPKGVMLTHYNLIANMRQMDGLEYFSQDDTLLCVLPLFHIYGLVVVLNMGLHLGATIVMMPRFDLEQFLGLIQ